MWEQELQDGDPDGLPTVSDDRRSSEWKRDRGRCRTWISGEQIYEWKAALNA